MDHSEFPLVLSPNLGCPHIVELTDDEVAFDLLVATRHPDHLVPTRKMFEGVFRLVPSYDGQGRDVDLIVVGEPCLVSDWNQLSDFSDLRETRLLVSRELHYKVLGEGTRYCTVRVAAVNPGDPNCLRDAKPGVQGRKLPTLYDLLTLDESGKYRRANPHAVQLVHEIGEGDCRFLHLTDAHVAKRNDEMLDEIVKVRNDRSEDEIRAAFVNFNDNFRRVIRAVNARADRGELDFLILTGDLVDQAFHGWADEVNRDENNYKEFIDIVTGAGLECNRGNDGLRIAMFTSTGNHDWRLHPYDPALGRAKTFGLNESEARRFPYTSFDAAEYPEDERSRLAREISREALKKIHLESFNTRDRWKIRFGKAAGWVHSSRRLMAVLWGSIPATATVHAIFFDSIDTVLSTLDQLHVLPYLALAAAFVVRRAARHYSRKMANLLVDNPLHAEGSALHYYFTHINPYLDYGFSFGRTHFLMLDGGADAFVGNILDGKERKRLRRLSLSDNLIGGSPDSRSFDSEQLYLSWSQIVWLQKALGADSIQKRDPVFVGIHAPPVNVPVELFEKLGSWQKFYYRFRLLFRRRSIYHKITSWRDLWESNPHRKTAHPWISRDEVDLTYGTINHYVSQLFYLCFGLAEANDYDRKTNGYKRRVTMVLAGHAHRNIEFSVDLHWDRLRGVNEIRILSDHYSDPEFDLDDSWRRRPLMIQTAACGPMGACDREPPYYRQIEIAGGVVQTFKVFNEPKQPIERPAASAPEVDEDEDVRAGSTDSD